MSLRETFVHNAQETAFVGTWVFAAYLVYEFFIYAIGGGDSTQGEVLEREAVIDMECDIWIPAARPDVLDKNNIDRLKTKMVVQGANIPLTPEAEQYLHEKGVLSIPDFIANAGGVICAAVEYYGGTERGAFQTIKEKITRNTGAFLGVFIA